MVPDAGFLNDVFGPDPGCVLLAPCFVVKPRWFHPADFEMGDLETPPLGFRNEYPWTERLNVYLVL